MIVVFIHINKEIKNMNADFEGKICKMFFNKKCCERLTYELLSKKKRGEFFRKMSHSSKLYVGNCIFLEQYMPCGIDKIIEFLEDDVCYFITTFEKYDGEYCELQTVLSDIWSNGMPYMIVNRKCDRAYLETEYNFSEHISYFLKR